MERNLKGQLRVLKEMNIKPNYSELARMYGVDRHTVKRYDEGYEGKPAIKVKPSKVAKYCEEIKIKLEIPGARLSAVYQFFKDKSHDTIGSYSNFVKYVAKEKILVSKSTKVHLRFETDPGEQLQADWKEDLSMTSRTGGVYEFNVFTSTLGYSRLHVFVYSVNRTRQDVEYCLIKTFKYINGVPKSVLTDNMSSIIDTVTKKNRINKEFAQFAKDMNFEVKKCKIHSPETKGKDESANRFINWLIPYNGEFETEDELIEIIEHINKKVNMTKNQTTNIEPALLFQKEKEQLSPLPSNKVLNSYLTNDKLYKVGNDLLVHYRGQSYSVGMKYINRSVTIKELDNTLQIYHNKNLISVHELSDKKINYLQNHYQEAMRASIKHKTDEEITKIVEENLKRFDNLKY